MSNNREECEEWRAFENFSDKIRSCRGVVGHISMIRHHTRNKKLSLRCKYFTLIYEHF